LKQCYVTNFFLKLHHSYLFIVQIVKCTNEECCSPMVSSLRTILPTGFLLVPLAFSNDHGLKLDETSSQFLSLFHSITVTLQPNGYDKLTVPYDLFCPSVSALVAKRTCNACKLYFPSNVMLVQHKQAVHPKHKIAEVPKCRPVRITARRQRELMAIIAAGIEGISLPNHYNKQITFS